MRIRIDVPQGGFIDGSHTDDGFSLFMVDVPDPGTGHRSCHGREARFLSGLPTRGDSRPQALTLKSRKPCRSRSIAIVDDETHLSDSAHVVVGNETRWPILQLPDIPPQILAKRHGATPMTRTRRFLSNALGASVTPVYLRS